MGFYGLEWVKLKSQGRDHGNEIARNCQRKCFNASEKRELQEKNIVFPSINNEIIICITLTNTRLKARIYFPDIPDDIKSGTDGLGGGGGGGTPV